MNFRNLFLSLALVAGVFALSGCKKAVETRDYKVLISPVYPSYNLIDDGYAYPQFKVRIFVNGGEVSDYEDNWVECEITAQGGTISHPNYRSGKQGDVYATFYPADPENFSGGSVVVTPVILKCRGLTLTTFGGDKSAMTMIYPAP